MTSTPLDQLILGGGPLQATSEQCPPAITRRHFMRLSGTAGFGLALMCSPAARLNAEDAADPQHPPRINAYIQLDATGRAIIYAPNPDMGQGVKTSLPMIIAEEMDLSWSDVTVEYAPVDGGRFGRQYAGGSRSVATRWQEMRQLGATARRMLLQAAAQHWSVDISELEAANSRVTHTTSNRQVSYGELAVTAAKQQVPGPDTAFVFKQPGEYRIIGQRIGNVDNPAMVTGHPVFSIDTQLPDMQYAVYARCPTLGGRPHSANLAEIKSMPGVIDAFIIEGSPGVAQFDAGGDSVTPGVAVVAHSTWQAINARKALEIDWDLGQASADDTAQLEKQSLALLNADDGDTAIEKGAPASKIASSSRVLSTIYSTAMVSHAQLEPQSCTAWYRGDNIELWASSQTPGLAQQSLQTLLGLPPEKITIHQLRGGGGFGRRLNNDYVREAALIARHTGKPVKLQWSREDDMAHDFYRPPALYKLTASLDDKGQIEAWDHKSVAVSPDGSNAGLYAAARPGLMPEPVIENYRMRIALAPFKTPVGAVRAPITNTYAFAEQSFMHELAVAAQRDHLAFMLDLLGEPRQPHPRNLHTGRAANVIKRAAELAGWGRSLPAGSGLGLSFFFSHAAHVAEIAEVSVSPGKEVRVVKVWVVADIGTVVNPSGAEAQLQGSVIDGLSTLAAQQITVAAGQVQQSNFHEYPLLRHPAAPDIDIEFLSSGHPPTGVGEPGLPPLAGAVCNAIYAATGQRIHKLPISREGYTVV